MPAYCRIAGIPDQDVQRIRDAYTGGELMEAEQATDLVTDQMIDAFTLSGTPLEVREKISVLTARTPVRHFVFLPMGEDRLSVIRAFAAAVSDPESAAARTLPHRDGPN